MTTRIVEQIRDKRFLASFATSSLLHVALLVAFWVITIGVRSLPTDLVFDSILTEDNDKPEEQIQVLRKDDTVSTTVNTTPGGVVSTNVSTKSNRRLTPSQNFNVNDQMAELDVAPPNPNAVGIGRDEFVTDLGEEGFKGEPTAMVSGYPEALNRITKEIIRLMRKDTLLVVWLFDESESMKDDRQAIADNFEIVYRELGLHRRRLEKRKRGGASTGTLPRTIKLPKKSANRKSPAGKKRAKGKASSKAVAKKNATRTRTPRPRKRPPLDRNAILLTSIYGYGDAVHPMLSPTHDEETIIQTIKDGIPIDETGKERMCSAIAKVITANRTLAGRQKRKLVLIVVTDESGDDGMAVEKALAAAKLARSPLYFLGREAVFGYPYARQRWVDPKYKLPHWIRINRGPETAFPECLQWDGLHARWDVFSSGFGPYEQVRLARETNGIFFVLPDEETNLVGAGARDRRQFADDDMREYHPMWLSRGQYSVVRKRSKFRETIWEVIVALNPTKHEELLLPVFYKELNIREHHYPIDLGQFKQVAAREVVKAYFAWRKLASAIQLLDRIEPLRAKEESARWRANYDLARAQCLAFRVRLFQFLLRMDAHVNANPPRKVPEPRAKRKKSNEWWFRRTTRMISPDEAQFERVKKFFNLKMSRTEFLASLKQDEDKAREMYQLVVVNHPGTPWARRAQWELNHGFGMEIHDVFWDPRYRNRDIKVPKF